MARNMAIDYGMPYFFLEMASVQLITRLISSETGSHQRNCVPVN
jgi:replicative DNA helicase